MPKEEMFTLFGRESNDEPFTQARAHHKHTSIAHLVKDYEGLQSQVSNKALADISSHIKHL